MVEGLDATAVKKIRKIMNYTKEAGVQVLFCDVLPQMIHQMEHDEIDPHEYPNMTFHDDIDLGIEFACDQILLRPNHNFTFIKRTAEGAWKLKVRHCLCRAVPRSSCAKTACGLPDQNIVKGIIQFQRLGFHDFVNGERFDSVSFRQAGKAQVLPTAFALCTSHCLCLVCSPLPLPCMLPTAFAFALCSPLPLLVFPLPLPCVCIQCLRG